jgi:nucleoside-diphosphate-sugar epimerase
MRVLITGAAGFLGRAFAFHHILAGDEVIGVDDLSNAVRPADLIAHENFLFVHDDAGEYLGGARSPHDLAYHFAAPVGGRERIELDPLFNADSLRLDSMFFRWAIDHAPRVVYPSSSAVYGVTFQREGGHKLSEELFHPAQTNWPAPDEMYGFTKMAGEVLAAKAARYRLTTLCIRPFSGYGEGQRPEYPIPSILRRALQREDPLVIWGSGKQRRDFVHVSDIVGATEARLRQPWEGYAALNIGSGIPVSFLDIAAMAAVIVGYDPQITTDPSKPEGVLTRYADTTQLNELYTPRVTLRDGLKRVLEDMGSVTHSRSF